MYVNLSFDEGQKARTQQELQRLKALADKYKQDGFTVYGTFTYDIQGGDDLSNKDILKQLMLMNFYNPNTLNNNLKFLAKVSLRQ